MQAGYHALVCVGMMVPMMMSMMAAVGGQLFHGNHAAFADHATFMLKLDG